MIGLLMSNALPKSSGKMVEGQALAVVVAEVTACAQGIEMLVFKMGQRAPERCRGFGVGKAVLVVHRKGVGEHAVGLPDLVEESVVVPGHHGLVDTDDDLGVLEAKPVEQRTAPAAYAGLARGLGQMRDERGPLRRPGRLRRAIAVSDEALRHGHCVGLDGSWEVE